MAMILQLITMLALLALGFVVVPENPIRADSPIR
jgi:hypothetical protein